MSSHFRRSSRQIFRHQMDYYGRQSRFHRRRECARSPLFNVRESPIQSTLDPIGSRQVVEKMWSITGDQPLEKLRLSLPGLTYISVDPTAVAAFATQNKQTSKEDSSAAKTNDNATVAVIRVSSDAEDLLESVLVQTRFPDRTLLDFDDSGFAHIVKGNLLTEIFLPHAFHIRNLGAMGRGDVVVEDQVLVNGDRNNIIKLAACRDHSRVFVNTPAETTIGAVKIAAARGGEVYFANPEKLCVANGVDVAIANGGKVQIQTKNFEANELKVAIFGSGDVRTTASGELTARNVKIAVAGGGNVFLGAASSKESDTDDNGEYICENQYISIAGQGKVDSADVIAKFTRVSTFGRAKVAVQTTDVLSVATAGAAQVDYLDPSPSKIESLGIGNDIARVTKDAAARRKSKLQRQEEHVKQEAIVPTKESAFDPSNVLHVRRFGLFRRIRNAIFDDY